MTRAPDCRLPAPFDGEEYHRLRIGIHDDPDVAVYINEKGDFAHLSPLVATDYRHYESRVKRFNLGDYKQENRVFHFRYEKLASLIQGACSFIEVGAGDCGFLAHVREHHPALDYACIEPDENTRDERNAYSWLRQFESPELASSERFDLVGLFHVLEHVLEPASLLNGCADLLSKTGRLIIEVPSLNDPLLRLYGLESYEEFFFQRQHPFYYSASSLERLLGFHGLKVECMIFHQRYGIENHLNWLVSGKPGGSPLFRSLFVEADRPYREGLEASGHSDSVIAVAVRANQ